MVALSICNVLPAIRDKELEFDKYANLLGVLVARAARWEFVGARPIEITVDITTTCNLKCPYCGTGNGQLQRPTSTLTPGLHSKILDFCGRQSFIHWYFSNGEPLLNKALPTLMRAASDYGIFSAISTNLSVPVSRDRLQELVHSGVGLISCSIDGACEETYKQYRVGGNFNLVMDNLTQLIELKKEYGTEFPIIEWRYLLFEHNQHEVKEVITKAKNVGVDLLEFFYGNAPPNPPPGQVRLSTMRPLSVEHVHGAYLEKAKLRRDTPLRKYLGDRTLGVNNNPNLDLAFAKCDWLYLGGMYYPDQKVGPCCVVGNTSTDFGDHAKHTYPDIWNNAHYKSARRLLANPASPGVRTVCARCPLPQAQNFMFRDTLRGYLLNAPDWFLKIVGAKPETFFHPYDFQFLADDVAAIRNFAKQASAISEEIPRKLDMEFADRQRVKAAISSAIDKT